MPSDVFPPNSTPRVVDKHVLLEQIDFLRWLIENDDSMEGAIMYAWSEDEPGKYEIGGILRTGNSMGQGGVRILWDR